jgi:hypothetical protein
MPYRLGKLAPKRDDRTIPLRSILVAKTLPPVPPAWNVDRDSLGTYTFPPRMWLNDTYGDCVMAGRANQTERFEAFEQSTVLPITDKEVLKEYLKESGGQDSGLVMLDAMNAWRKGWKAAGKIYAIYAYAKLNSKNVQTELQVAVRYLTGVQVGVALPNNWQDQLDAGQPWHTVAGKNGKPNPQNGHCIYIVAYDASGPTCWTWGQRQKMTWEWFAKCCDEAYGIVDQRDSFVKNSPVDVKAADAYLKAVST